LKYFQVTSFGLQEIPDPASIILQRKMVICSRMSVTDRAFQIAGACDLNQPRTDVLAVLAADPAFARAREGRMWGGFHDASAWKHEPSIEETFGIVADEDGPGGVFGAGLGKIDLVPAVYKVGLHQVATTNT
jgi:hypothetical protein